MAYENSLVNVTGIASADLSASQYCFINIDTNGQVALAAAAANAEGVLQDKPSAALASCAYAISGISKVKASAAIAKGDNVASAANGKARTATTADFILGTALTSCSNADEFISVLLNKGGKL